MKIIYPRVCGIDVHKQFIVAVICISESVEPIYLKKRFSTFHNDLIRFRNWLIQNDCRLPSQTATCAIFGGHSAT